MTSTDQIAVLRKKLSTIMNVPVSGLEQRAYKNLVEAELKNVEIDMFKILNKHGMKDSIELDSWFQEGRIEEAAAWEDYFELDGLEYKRRMLGEILDELS
jgi:hypothetical protein